MLNLVFGILIGLSLLGSSLGRFINRFFWLLCILSATLIARFSLGIEAISIMTIVGGIIIWIVSIFLNKKVLHILKKKVSDFSNTGNWYCTIDFLKMKKALILLFAITYQLPIHAEGDKIIGNNKILHNGVYYRLDKTQKEASVARPPMSDVTYNYEKYRGDIVIDSLINYDGVDYTVTRIEEQAFSGSLEITSFSIPNTIKIIEREAFEYTPFTVFYAPERLEKIGYRAFADCSDLERIYLPATLKDINSYIFGGDYNLKQIDFPSQAAIDQLGEKIATITQGARLAKVYVNGKPMATANLAKTPIVVKGNFYWKYDAQENKYLINEAGKTILPAGVWDKVWLDNIIVIKKNGKFGAYSYAGTKLVSAVYDSFQGYGAEGRLLFSNNTPNGMKLFVFSKKGALLASKAFTNSQKYSAAAWIKDWMNIVSPFELY